MNVNATQAELRAIAEVLELAAILDDRAPGADRARIAGWAEQIHRHRLEREDLLDGVQTYYDNPSDRAIQIGDLIHHARNVKRARLDKEADRVREERREAQDAKVAADEVISSIVITGPSGPVMKTKKLISAENALQCVTTKHEAIEAIRAYFAAKAEAKTAA